VRALPLPRLRVNGWIHAFRATMPLAAALTRIKELNVGVSFAEVDLKKRNVVKLVRALC